MDAITKLHSELSIANVDVEQFAMKCEKQVQDIKQLSTTALNMTKEKHENNTSLTTLSDQIESFKTDIATHRGISAGLEVTRSCVEAELNTIAASIAVTSAQHVIDSTKLISTIETLSRRVLAEPDIRADIATTLAATDTARLARSEHRARAVRESVLEKKQLRQQLVDEEESLSLVLASIEAYNRKNEELESSLEQQQANSISEGHPTTPNYRVEEVNDSSSPETFTGHTRRYGDSLLPAAMHPTIDLGHGQATAAISHRTVTTTTTVNTTVMATPAATEFPGHEGSDATPWYRQLKKRRVAPDHTNFYGPNDTTPVDENIFYS